MLKRNLYAAYGTNVYPYTGVLVCRGLDVSHIQLFKAMLCEFLLAWYLREHYTPYT